MATPNEFERCDVVLNGFPIPNAIVTREAPASGGGFYYGFFVTAKVANKADEFSQCFEVLQDRDLLPDVRDMAARNAARLSRGILFDTATVLPEDRPLWLD
jgi:hypothetical protein